MEKIFILFVTVVLPALCMAQGKDVFDTARTGTVDEMKVLVKKNTDTINAINAAGFSPLILACYRGNNGVAEYLARNVKDVNYNSSNGTALAAAAVKGNTALAKLLLENKANPNLPDGSGMTPIVYAIQFENKDLVTLLLQHKAKTDIKDNDGHTPYDHAVISKNQEIINLFKK